MGFENRDYAQYGYGQQQGMQLGGPKSMTVKIILFTFAVYFAQQIFGAGFLSTFSLDEDWYTQPWKFYQLLTYGFIHAQNDFRHIAFNMLGLFFFGRPLEEKYGQREFLVFYLVTIIVSGIAWNMPELLVENMQIYEGVTKNIPSRLLGASGGCMGAFVLFVLNYPRATVLLFFVIPVPAWLLGIGWFLHDVYAVIFPTQPVGSGAGSVAYLAHVGGMVFGWVYFHQQWALMPWFNSLAEKIPTFKNRKLHVYRSENEPALQSPMEQKVDQILAKVKMRGEESLTEEEREILERASERYRNRRR